MDISLEGSVHDVNALDHLPIEAGAYYVMDKGYVDFKRLHRLIIICHLDYTIKDNISSKGNTPHQPIEKME